MTLEASVRQLRDFILERPRLMVLTGAGISQRSGIPTYRDAAGAWTSSQPIQHGEFMRDPAVRKRYWARSYKGWPNVASARPNPAHLALSHLEAQSYVQCLVTQNIDRLHQKAGHQRVIDLHGRLDQVVCMDCGEIAARADVQQWLASHNSHLDHLRVEQRPDGDAEIEGAALEEMQLPSCVHCSGLIKPNVVFYGGSVDKKVISKVFEQLSQSDALLVVGSSLMVYSSFRYCKFAHDHDIPILCINQGLTRADKLLRLKVRLDCADALTQLADSLPVRG